MIARDATNALAAAGHAVLNVSSLLGGHLALFYQTLAVDGRILSAFGPVGG
jgi:hypothetical protein